MSTTPMPLAPALVAPSRRAPALLRFWAMLTPQVLLAPIFCFGITLLHEIAHASAALAVGGEVLELTWLPGANDLGHMRWQPPAGADELDHAFVSVAPYLMWAAFAAVVLVLAWLPNRFHWSAASTLFVWGYAVPIGDIAGNLASPRGDLSAPGIDGVIAIAAGGVAVLIAWALGWLVQRRLFPDAQLGPLGYAATTIVMGGAWAIAATLGVLVVTFIA